MKNITVGLLVITLAYAGYYMYAQNKNAGLVTSTGSTLTEGMLADTQLFIERRAVLNAVKMDLSVIDNRLFRSYRSFSEPIKESPVGRENPFVTPISYNVNKTQ